MSYQFNGTPCRSSDGRTTVYLTESHWVSVWWFAETWGPPSERSTGLMLFWVSTGLLGVATQTHAGLDGGILLLTLLPLGMMTSIIFGQPIGLTGKLPILGFLCLSLVGIGTMSALWKSGLSGVDVYCCHGQSC